MKYFNFKRHKFSTLIKNLNIRNFNFSRILKILDLRKYNFLNIFKNINFKLHNFSKIYKDFDLRKFDFSKIYKFIDFRKFDFSKIYKFIDFRKFDFSKIYKFIELKKTSPFIIHGVGFLFLFIIIYLIIPMFFNYEKSKIKKVLCGDLNITCSIEGKVKYSFVPTPRLKIKKIIIHDFKNKNQKLGEIENGIIKISILNLFNKKKQTFKKIELDNAKIYLNLENLDLYRKFIKKKFISKPIKIKKTKIEFFEGENYITKIDNAIIKYNTKNKKQNFSLKGSFLEDEIILDISSIFKNNISKKIFKLKIDNLNLFSKIEIFDNNPKKDLLTGNALLKKDKNRLTAIFSYSEDGLVIKQSNIRNAFLDGKLSGKVKILPYFNFNLDLNLNNVNFNKLANIIISLEEEEKRNLFIVNNKINGQMNLSANKIFSKNTLIDTFESRIKLINGDIVIDQLLLSLGKLGAADLTGIIENEKKFTTLKFEKNIFLDNYKKFFSRFGIYNVEKIPPSLFVSGSFDLVNLDLRLNEISNQNKFNDEDVAYVEKEFNNLLLGEGYESLFNFANLKEFVRVTINENY